MRTLFLKDTTLAESNFFWAALKCVTSIDICTTKHFATQLTGETYDGDNGKRHAN